MNRRSGDYVIIGGGLAGAKAAETLRDEGFDGRVVIVAKEPERPYERPPLSKDYLQGTSGRDAIFVHDAGWYAENDVELLESIAAVDVDRHRREVELGDGERIGYDRLLLATGSTPRRLQVPGADLGNVMHLRNVGDTERLRAVISGGGARVVVVGAGWIGLETAAAARTYGCPVTVIEPQPTPLYGALGPELGEVFADLHGENGVRLLLGTGVAELIGGAAAQPGEPHPVRAVVTDSGERLPADLVVVGVGARPETELAEWCGLEVDDGVVVDAALRSSDPAIHAAGDVASVYMPRYGRQVRVEHWANALNSGPAAARSMLGADVTYDELPYFFTDQYDLGMEFSGLVTPGGYDRIVYRGDTAGREFIAFWLDGRRVVAGMNVNVWNVTDDVRALIDSGARVDPDRLADPGVPLSSLTSASPAPS
ncbi:MAG: NAD(P)/FAD-dependent oxidoreductase [Streptosporangiales bacterium]|nr:NAD(P)/FAD-dependent oxidoreductase [Streptosporangiales bacterium]